MNSIYRHILKTISYRIIGTLITFFSSIILGVNVKISAILSISEIIIKPIFYFIHERVWFNLRFLKK
jgi:uncharacterized membrane protein